MKKYLLVFYVSAYFEEDDVTVHTGSVEVIIAVETDDSLVEAITAKKDFIEAESMLHGNGGYDPGDSTTVHLHQILQL